MARVLVTAGPVYGRLDDNKLVGNRVRGIWACKFAGYLASKGHKVTLLVSDTMPDDKGMGPLIGELPPLPGSINIIRHTGYESYKDQCLEMAPTHDAAVMAAAVVNWIPANPVTGKMPTAGYKEGDIIQVPFVLAPRVIQMMKAANPKLTLIGCKMLIGSEYGDLIDAAYSGVLLPSRCNAVVANDPTFALKKKWVVYPDRSVQHYMDDWKGFYGALEAVILDKHYETRHTFSESLVSRFPEETALFDRIVDANRSNFVKPVNGRDMVFGSLAVNTPIGWLCSPREKGDQFSAKDAVLVTGVNHESRVIGVMGPSKAALNAPLMVRFLNACQADAVLHQHQQLQCVPTLPYAPPGTTRDSNRDIPIEAARGGFNIEGHGFYLPIYLG